MLDFGPEGHEPSEAWVALAEARRLLRHSPSDHPTILALARSALTHVRVSHLLSATPGKAFLAERSEDVAQYIERLEAGGGTAACYATLLYALDFLLRASHVHTQAVAGFA